MDYFKSLAQSFPKFYDPEAISGVNKALINEKIEKTKKIRWTFLTA